MMRGTGCALVLLSLAVLGACRPARLLDEDKASDTDLNGVHSIDLNVLQKLADFPNCVASCAFVNSNFCDLEKSLAQTSDRNDLGHDDNGKQGLFDHGGQGVLDHGEQGRKDPGEQGHNDNGKQGLFDHGGQGVIDHGEQGRKDPGEQGHDNDHGHDDLRCVPNKMCFWDCLKHRTPPPRATTTPYHTTKPYQTTTPYPTTTPKETTKPYHTTTPYPTTTPKETTKPYHTTTPYPTTTPKETTKPYHTTTPYHTNPPKDKTCPNPYYPQNPYTEVDGCWYDKDSGASFLSGEAPACDQPGGWADPAAPAPLSNDNKPPATCCLCNSRAYASPWVENTQCNSCPDDQVCVRTKDTKYGGICMRPSGGQYVIGKTVNDGAAPDATPEAAPTSNEGKHKGGKFVCGCFHNS